MITESMIVFIIANFCAFKDPKITKTQKLECSDYMANCVIKDNGQTTNFIMNKCKDMWAERESREKRR